MLDVEAAIPPTSRALVRRVAGRILWIWYRVDDDEIVTLRVRSPDGPDRLTGGRSPVTFTETSGAVDMSWATGHIEKLKAGETVSFRPRGHSMTPKIKSGELCTVAPIADHTTLETGDIVLCKVNGSQYVHLVSAIQGERFQISNNKGHVNGWVTASAIYGKLVSVEP